MTKDNFQEPSIRIERQLLKDRGFEVLRHHIVSGQIRPGTKLVERDVAEMLGVSRAPARDALIQLEKEGLVVSGPDARYVIELDERDVRELFQVRLALEQLAVKLATENGCEENRAALLVVSEKMEEATKHNDHDAFGQADLEMHRLIWSQAENRHLHRALQAMLGPIFMTVAHSTERSHWQETLQSSHELIDHINSGDVQAALTCMARHLNIGLERALTVVRKAQSAAT